MQIEIKPLPAGLYFVSTPIGAARDITLRALDVLASADVLAASSTEIDISAIERGQAIKAVFRKQPLFVRNLTDKEIAEADAVPLSELRDKQTPDASWWRAFDELVVEAAKSLQNDAPR